MNFNCYWASSLLQLCVGRELVYDGSLWYGGWRQVGCESTLMCMNVLCVALGYPGYYMWICLLWWGMWLGIVQYIPHLFTNTTVCLFRVPGIVAIPQAHSVMHTVPPTLPHMPWTTQFVLLCQYSPSLCLGHCTTATLRKEPHIPTPTPYWGTAMFFDLLSLPNSLHPLFPPFFPFPPPPNFSSPFHSIFNIN